MMQNDLISRRMTDREKLIELVAAALCNQSIEEVAEHLLANGVTVQKWIPVTERLPADEMPVLAYYGFNNDGASNLAMMFMGTISYFCFEPNPHWQHASTGLVVTHWMPLPEPPKEE